MGGAGIASPDAERRALRERLEVIAALRSHPGFEEMATAIERQRGGHLTKLISASTPKDELAEHAAAIRAIDWCLGWPTREIEQLQTQMRGT